MAKDTYTSQERWTLLATILASSLVFIDGTALNIALPTIQQDMQLTGAELIWVVNAYALFLSALLLTGGALGDIYGRNKIFGIGLIIFMLSSLGCGMSVNAPQLIIGRALQGVGGALLTPGSLSILTAVMSSKKVGGAIGLWSTFSALTAIIGPVLGGWLAGIGMWRVIFFLNIPFSIFVLWAIFKKVPETKNEQASQLDLLGAFLATVGLGGITYGLIESSNNSIDDPKIIVSLSVGVISSVLFIFSQYFGKHPMMPLSLFKSKAFSVTNLATFFIYGAMSATLFFVPLNLIQIQGYAELQAGLAALPTILLITLMSAIVGRLTDRIGARVFLTIGPLITGLGYYTYTLQGITEGPSAYWTTFLIPTVLLGLGMGTLVAPLTTTVMSSVPKNNSGIASGVNNSISRMSGVIAVALMGTLAMMVFKTHLMEGIASFNLPDDVMQVLEKESVNLGGTKPPEGTPISKIPDVQLEVKKSFVVAFDQVAWSSAYVSWFSALLCFVFLKNKK